MSYTGVHKIKANGEVENVGDAHNSHGWCMHIWRSLDGVYRAGCGAMEYQKLWKMFGKPPMTERDAIVLGATFDAVWIKQEELPRLIAALESFWETHKTIRIDGNLMAVVPTIPRVIGFLKEIAADATARGACFHGTSTTDDPWFGTAASEDEDSPRFVFGKDTTTRHGGPWELFG